MLIAILGILLGIAGIVATCLLSDPAITWYRHLKQERSRRRWSADLHVDQKQIQRLEHYAFEYWRQDVTVDSAGNATHVVEARMINIREKLLERVTFPVYCDGIDIPDSEIQPWARCGKTQLVAKVEDWIAPRARGRVAISIAPPLISGERRKICWGYRLPRTFNIGDEYYNWDVATPHYEIGGCITFAKPWRILYVRWAPELIATQLPPELEDNKIKWMVRFPERGKQLTLQFGLTRDN